ncbi:DUF72 domain-containing protein [Pseudochryseolinea flava]|uniref:DUF72 domain-containing protein n=1 Tax=Pseudochryseolinea flava TaxID=2059302 RepID=A0A364Y7D1_9BACT|nr:DUF72 domain-containing protein [Pseudochryseolinea flava]RAW02171.1 DUF72 domain-containing protein [Pseudochryseolinea flava]
MRKQKSIGKFFGGISGLILPMPKYRFPAPFQHSSRLTYYASIFNSIEINRSFYILPKGKTMTKWSHEVEQNFKFTFKLWKEITHAKHLKFREQDVVQFIESIDHVGDKKGCILIQFPASINAQYLDQLVKLFNVIQKHNHKTAWRIAVEFRDITWYAKETYKLLKTYHAALVLHDKSKGSSPHITTAKDVYVRFHGPGGDYRGSYPDSFLREYATYIVEWLNIGKSVYVYFNNTMGEAFNNLQKLKEYIAEEMEMA